MSITENEVTNNLAFLSGRDKEVAYDFLLKPFGVSHKDIARVATQIAYGATIPDLVIYLGNLTEIRIEVKINNAPLTYSEKDPNNRDLFIVPDNYPYKNDIPVRQTTWSNFFNYCYRHGCEMAALNSLKYVLGL